MEPPFASTNELANMMDIAEADLPLGAALTLQLASAMIALAAPSINAVDEVTDSVKGCCLMVAQRVLNTSPGIAAETSGKASTTYDKIPKGFALTEDELDMLTGYRSRLDELNTSVHRP